MEDRMEPGQAGKIQELIRREKEEADRNFEGARFEERLLERVHKATETRPTTWLTLLRKPAPVVALSALVLVIAGSLLLRRLPPSSFQQTVREMSAVLAEAGDGRRAAEESRLAQRIATAEYTEFGWALKEVLYACERQALGQVSLTYALSRVLLEEAPRAAPRQAGEKVPFQKAQSPKLRSGEDFQLFFTGFLKKFEEV